MRRWAAPGVLHQQQFPLRQKGTIVTTTQNSTGPAAGRSRYIRWIGLLAIVAGALMVVAGGAVWAMVTTQLQAEKITVAEDASFMAGMPVAGPLTAYAQADIINHHALEMSNGLTYAELDREDPVRATVMNASFLRASLFTSVVSYGVAAFAIGVGVMFALFGWVVRTLAPTVRRTDAEARVHSLV